MVEYQWKMSYGATQTYTFTYEKLNYMYIKKSETERLIIRPNELSDRKAWEAFFVNNPSLDYLGFDYKKDNVFLAKEWMEIQLQRYKDNRYGHQALIDKESGKLIGQCGLLTQKIEEQEVIEIGYHLLPAYWGKGLATEAARFFRDFGFKNNIANEFVSIIDIRNIGSQKVAEKNGMCKVKQMKYFHLDVFIYKITKEEWLVMSN